MTRWMTILLSSMLSLQTATGQTPPANSSRLAASEKPITLESFARPPFLEDPELSPNGQWVAARISVGGRQKLAMLSLFATADNKPTMMNLDSEKISVDSWQWVNDDWLLVWLSANDNIEGATWRIGRVISIQRSTGKTVQLGWKEAAQNASDVIWIANDGSPRIYLSIQNSVYSNEDEFWPEVREFDVSTGKSKTIVRRRQDVSSYYTDAAGNVRLGYGYSSISRTAKLLYREPGKNTFSEIDRANLGKDEKLAFPQVFLPEPGKALTMHDDGKGFSILSELDLATLTYGARMFGIDGYDIDGLVLNAKGDGVAGIRLIEERPRVHWLDPDLAETQANFDKAVGIGRSEIVSWSQSRKQLLVRVGGPDQAGAFYYFDRSSGGKFSLVGYTDDNLRQRKLGSVSTIHYKARDGLDIPAVLTLPSNRKAKGLPLILLPHGGPQARDYEHWDWMAQFFAWKGYAVIQPNYRGSTGYGTKFTDAGLGEWGLKMQDDLNDAVTALAERHIADPKRVCVVGGSYGGYAAMRAAQRDGDKYRCAISYAGVSDLSAMSNYDSRFLYGREYRAGLKEKAPDFSLVSPLKHPEQFGTPILIMHGKLDLRVPVKQSREMAEQLKAAGKTYRYVEQPLGDHHFSRTEDRLQFLREAEAFLNQYNPS